MSHIHRDAGKAAAAQKIPEPLKKRMSAQQAPIDPAADLVRLINRFMRDVCAAFTCLRRSCLFHPSHPTKLCARVAWERQHELHASADRTPCVGPDPDTSRSTPPNPQDDSKPPDDGYDSDFYKDDEEREAMKEMNELERVRGCSPLALPPPPLSAHARIDWTDQF